MKVTRTEQHMIKRSHSAWKLIDDLCFKSKNLYNYANYLLRQDFINNKNIMKYTELAGIVKDSKPYKDIGSNVGQQTLKMLDKNWKSFFVAIQDWSKNPKKYLGKPKLPKYKNKDGRFVLGIDNIKFNIVDGYLRFSWSKLKPLNNIFKTNISGKLMQVRFVPKGNSYVLEIIYEIEVSQVDIKSKNIIAIDLGVNNFATISNNIGLIPIIINGRIIKSINQYYNRLRAKIQSELKIKNNKTWSRRLQSLTDKKQNRLNSFLHKASKIIIDYYLENKIDTIIVGINNGWKQKSKIGKTNNQNFTFIPYENFINKLKYKCENNGIKFIETEESYTSGTSFLDAEMPYKENYDKSRRITRGLFKADNGIVINADLNGSYQIMRKVIPNAFAEGIEGVGLHPVKLNII